MKSNRKIANIIVQPKQQFLIASYFFCAFIIIIALLIWYFVSSVARTMLVLKSTYQIDPELVTSFEGFLNQSFWTLVISLLLFAIVLFLIWLKLSHRIFGPLVPISKHISELTNGNYSSRVQLRNSDFMQELKNDLNVLAERLEKTKQP